MDETFQKELQAVGTQANMPIEAIIAFAEIHGYKITAEDISSELTDRELDAIAGGGTFYLSSLMVTSTFSDPLGTTVIPSGGMSPRVSDRRLKTNIKLVGTHMLGIGIYEYDIFGRHECGVMADEVERVRPEAVSIHPFGIKAVNYAAL
jgi:predicted ribosomally synthesized peptide with nif11-like leader